MGSPEGRAEEREAGVEGPESSLVQLGGKALSFRLSYESDACRPPMSPLLAGTPWLPRLFVAEKLLAGCPSSWSCPDGQGMRRMLVFLKGFRAAALKSP